MKYTALTIGPIHKTLQSVKSTKAIWAASYMFSYLMREIIKRLKKLSPKPVIIIPYSDAVTLTDGTVIGNPLVHINGAGLFPDRLIIEGECTALQNIIENVKKEFSKNVAVDISKKEEDVTNYLNNYLNFYHLTVEFTKKELTTKNIIFRVNELLDSLELQQRILTKPEPDFLNDFFEKKYYNFLIRGEFDKDNKRRFPPTIEIAKAEYKDIDEKKYKHLVNIHFEKKEGKDKDSIDTQQKFIDEIKKVEKFKLTVRQYQKYIAIVQADGDNMGVFIKELYKQPNAVKLVECFSKNLLSFTIDAVKLIEEYKGTPIYAGGDDLLFFAPVAHTTVTKENEKEIVKIDKTIFTLIDKIDELFKKYFHEVAEFKSIITKENLKKKPSMSYGVSISYYKFPLNEALEEGVNQLFGVAKQTGNKNAVSYTILKHSGQTFGATFNKNETSYNTFNKLIRHTESGDNYIHSIVFKLEPQQAVLKTIGQITDKSQRDKMFDNFFFNNFDESIHRKKNNREELVDFLKFTKLLFKNVYSENELTGTVKEIEKKNKQNLQKIYAALRFIDFILNKEERDE